jgi:hypothetical protein
MYRLLTALAIMALFTSLATAGDVPTRTTVANATSTAATWTVPNFHNGELLEICLYDTTPGAAATCTVKQVVAVTSTRSLTNTLFTMVAASNTKTLTSQVNSTNGPLARLVPGDILQFVMTGGDTGQVSLTRNVSSP